jgi:ribonuclease R
VTEAANESVQQRILARLRRGRKKHHDLDELAAKIDHSPEQFQQALDALIASGDVVLTRNDKVSLPDRLGLVAGRVSAGRRGRAVVVPDQGGPPISLSRGELSSAMHRDRVLVEVAPYTRHGLRSGKVHSVLERGYKTMSGTVASSSDGTKFFVPRDPRFGSIATLVDDSRDAEPDHVVEAEIVEYPTTYRPVSVRVTRDLGLADRLPTEIETVCATLGIDTEFSEAVEREAGRWAQPTQADFEGRLDLRDQVAVTIDPADARDHDDAVSIRKTKNGWCLIVSIADVSHYVSPGTAIDDEAFERGTSTYFPGRCVPMLPESLSADLASLRPDLDRLSFSATLDVADDGTVRDATFSRSVIRSRAGLSYEQVQAALDGQAGELDAGIVEALREMHACAQSLTTRRMARGAIDLDLPEARFILAEDGRVEDIQPRKRLASHRVIEEFMLAANEAVARFLNRTDTPALYRIHESPDPESAFSLASRLRSIGIRIDRDGADLTPAILQQAVRDAAGTPKQRLINTMVLRSMQQARYSAYKDIHFGLASPCYTHFTSPIRRYPDLVVHRALGAVIDDQVDRLPPVSRLEFVAGHCSSRERRAMEAERDVARAAAILLMSDHIGERFAGTVVGVERYGFRVELDRFFVEGFVHVGKLPEFYSFVSERLELQSTVSDKVIYVGLRLTVVVISTDLGERCLDFAPSDTQ